MSDLRDFTGKNRKFTGILGEIMSSGTTAQRDSTYGSGTLRFNTTTNLMEYFEGTDWKAIDSPPTITTVEVDGASAASSGVIPVDGGTTSTVVINGSLFDTTGATVTLVPESGGATVNPASTTRNSANKITITVTQSDLDTSNDPYTITVTNGSGLAASLASAILADSAPTFTTAAGTLGTLFDSGRSGSPGLAPAAATDAESDTITYSITSGALPSGLSFNTTNAAITGTANAVGTNTTSPFTVRAATPAQSTDRTFSITVNAPTVSSYTSTGSQTFAVPSGVSAVDVLVVAGGGSGGPGQGGGGGAGGLIYRPGFPVTPGGNVSLNVGAGMPVSSTRYPNPGTTSEGSGRGYNTTFGNLTAIGGGSGWGDDHPGTPGGSGGAGSDNSGSNGGSGIQPSQPMDSGSYGFGNSGGRGGTPMDQHAGGGGGGAGASGQGAENGKQGGIGRQYDISGSNVYYAGGGRGGWSPARSGGSNSQQQGGGGGGGNGGQRGGDGVANRGGGGGGSGGSLSGSGQGSSGGSGIVIVKY